MLGTGDLPRHARDVAQLPLSLGGLGLASAVRNSVPAFWASWADSLAVLSRRLPRVAQEFLDHLDSPDPQPACFAAAAAARAALGHSDWAPPAWREMSAGESAPLVQEEGPSTFLRGWQGQAAAAEARRHRETLLAGADPAAQALLHSQSGPFASRFLTTVPVSSVLSYPYPCHLFRVLLLRRLRLPLPFAERTCRCRRLLDPFGDHRAACARSGVLWGCGCPLERAAARVCREAGARVTSNTRLADLNLQVDRVDDRRLESWPMASHCGGASNLQWTQPLSRPCQARASPFGAGVESLVLPSPWRAVAKSGPTQSSCGRTDAGWSCLQSRLAGGGVMRPPPSSGPWPAPGHLKRQLGCAPVLSAPLLPGGRPS